MQLVGRMDRKPYINVIFGNFYSPAYDDEGFIDRTMQLIKELGFHSVMFDTKAWEDFRERYETGAFSQYVKMQEYMGHSAVSHKLAYNFLLLYLNGDNLYPHIRFSPPIYGEETVLLDGRPGRWYKYWSEAAKTSMKEHVERIMTSYGWGCERCLVWEDGKEREVIPVCSMWDPVVAPSFDRDGQVRYLGYLEKAYEGDVERLNQRYGMAVGSFLELKPEEYWYSLRYKEEVCFSEEDVRKRSPRFWVWVDNMRWKMQELVLYFQDMQKQLKEKNPELFLCPNLTQWGYFLNIFGREQMDLDNDFSDLWDTAMRGIDIYALAPYVDSCHFITVPITPDGCPDAYVVSCQHSMMRVMNVGKPMVGGIYWGRFLYQDIYAFLTPAEIIGTMAACGVDGYSCYGINGLDDGGVLNRMEEDFLESLTLGNKWFSEVSSRRGGVRKKEIALLFPAEMAHFEPFEVGNNKIRRLDLLGWYRLCCDLGYQVDVISYHEVERGVLSDYQVLISTVNDCYFVAEHKKAEAKIQEWVRGGGVFLHGPMDMVAEACFSILGEECEKVPYSYEVVIIPQGERFCRYTDGNKVAEYIEGKGCCVAEYGGDLLRKKMGEEGDVLGRVYSFGVQIGASYAAKNIPHVPYNCGNQEMYPLVLAKTRLVQDILERCKRPISGITEKGIETGVFENGMIIVNHRSTPYLLKKIYRVEQYQYLTVYRQDGYGVLAGHSAVWVSDSQE